MNLQHLVTPAWLFTWLRPTMIRQLSDMGSWFTAAGEVGRAFKFKAELASTTANISPSVSVLEGIVEY